MMRNVQLDFAHADDYVEALVGRQATQDDYDPDKVFGGENADVFTPDGALLLKYRAGAISRELCDAVRPSLRKAARKTYNRSTAGGGRREHKLKADGTLSDTLTADPMDAGIVGYFDRTSRWPYCRTTAFAREHLRHFGWIVRFAQAADVVFAENCPERHGEQMMAVALAPPEWVLLGTAFTTATVNNTFATTYHVDAGDLAAGFGVISVVEKGNYSGCLLVFPKYRVAVDLRTTDVLLCDVHQIHGNTPFVGRPPGTFERLAAVFYFRANMVHCLPRADELRRAKARRPGEPLNGLPR